MHRKGFDYRPVPDSDHSREASASPYLLLQIDRARTDGYGILAAALDPSSHPTNGLNDQLIAALPEPQRRQWDAALLGTDANRDSLLLPDGAKVSFATDGCVFAVQEQLYGHGWVPLYYTFQGLTNIVIRATENSTEMSQAAADWAACMHEHGHTYSTLIEPHRDISARISAMSDSMQERRDLALYELRTAQHDVACQRRVHLHEKVAAAQQTAETATLSAANREDLAKLRVMRAEAIQYGEHIISSSTRTSNG
jgi:hypothetical protein